MAEYSRFFGGPEEAIPEYNQTHDAEVYRLIFISGVFSGVENELEVVENDPPSMSVKVKAGWSFVYGFWYHNDAVLIKSLGASDPVNPRIDRIILRLDVAENFKISCEVLEGTPAAEPTPPELTQTASIYEISLAQVLVGAGVTSVTNANITDEREYASLGDKYVTLTDVQTLTNKRITKRSGSVASTGSLTIDADIYDEYNITALAEPLTVNAPSGTPQDGDTLLLWFKDNGTGRALDFNAIFLFIGIGKPTTTTAGKQMAIGFKYKTSLTKWVCPAAIAQED